MLEKGQPKKAENGQVLKIWYILHHGVAYRAKPGKVRVAFDCSEGFVKTFHNKQLITGPNLTIQLIGVLTRFREEHTAHMVHIEPIFHQARIAKNKRSLLRFLWWEHGNPRMVFDKFEMCVHLFGGSHHKAAAITL